MPVERSELRLSWVALLLAAVAGVVGTLLVQNAFTSADETSNAARVSRRVTETTADDAFSRPGSTLPATTTTTAVGEPSLVLSPRVQKMMLALDCTLTGDADFQCPGPNEYTAMTDTVADEERCKSDDADQQIEAPDTARQDCDGDGNPG